jgi:hypothetical protein
MTWDGIANGPELTMAEKAAARRNADMDEDNERQLRSFVGDATEYVKRLWREGSVDILTSEGGIGAMVMTQEQAAWWRSQREADQ